MTILTRNARTIALIGGLLLIAGARDVRALPRFSLLTGTRCSACHFTPHGGGLRNELGWSAMDKVGLFRWGGNAASEGGDDLFGSGDADGSDLFADSETSRGEPADTTGAAEPSIDDAIPAHEPVAVDEEPASPSNAILDGLITPGADIRIQVAKIGPAGEERRMVLPMQTNLYLGVTPTDWLSVFGGYNFSTLKYAYVGQSAWEAAVLLHLEPTLPTLRIGYIQPSIGIRQDDHTMFMRREVGESGTPIIPPGFSEIGAELAYEGIHWLTVNAGVFNARNLSDIERSIGVTSYTDVSNPSLLARIMLWPQHLDLGINGEIGVSWFGNGDFVMVNAFAGIGLSDRASFFVEAMQSRNSSDRRVRNVSVMGTYQLAQWLSLDWRYEWAQTEMYPSKALGHAHAAVFGLEFFPLPFVEIRPEYRMFQREPFQEVGGSIQGQYAIQLHLFY